MHIVVQRQSPQQLVICLLRMLYQQSHVMLRPLLGLLAAAVPIHPISQHLQFVRKHDLVYHIIEVLAK
jgi:hypothetical protein